LKKPVKLTREEKFILTSEDWYPTYATGLVRVALLRLSTGQWRVCVWGADDFGLERDLPSVERQSAKRLYGRITDYTTQAQMRAWGMVNA
jgi:hypothetical protein